MDLQETLVSFGLNLLSALLVVLFQNYLSSRPSSQVGATAASTLLLAIVGFALGAASIGARDWLAARHIPFGTAGAEIVLVLTCLGLALTRLRSQAGVLRYQLEVLALWVPFVAAWLWFNPVESYVDNFIPVAVGLYLACASIGGVLTLLLRRASA